MVGATTHHQQQQASQLAPPPSSSSSSAAPVTTPEDDELLKRNTDCVYFLASPLTCKKGSECEYRHTDIARVNPRDCWYWLNGNCLNPKCAFRHPPLDGLLGAEVSTPMGPSVPAPHSAPYGMPKQGVACIFFQKGFCLKGHLCPFLHGPANNKAAQPGSANPISEPPKMASSGPDKPIQDPKIIQQVSVQKPVEFQFPKGKQAPRTQAPLPARNGVDKKVPPPSNMGAEDPLRYKLTHVVSKPVYHAYHVSDNDRIMSAKGTNEYSRDPSPGFDVLVENKHGDSEYYNEKDEFGRSRGHDYDIDRDVYHKQHDYDRYNERDGRRASSERMLAGCPRSDSPVHFKESDLRHRISKQRRGSDDGLRVPRRDSHHHHHHHRQDEGALSSRLRGRIKIPRRSISPHSPGRQLPLNQSRLRDRIKGRELIYDNTTEFPGPKRLSELKSGRNGEVLGKRRVESREAEEDLSFEGPKPLSEILKRKRGVDNLVSSVNSSNNNSKEDNNKETEMISGNKEEHNSVEGSGKMEKEEERGDYEGGLMDEDALLDEELEAYEYDNKEGDYDYDGEEEDYNLDESEYVEEEEEGKKDDAVYE